MVKLLKDAEFLVSLAFISMFISCAVLFTASEAADEPKPEPKPAVDNPSAAELQARLEKDKKYQTCKQKLDSLRSTCLRSAGNLSLPGGYVCENRRLVPSSTPVAVEGSDQGCVSSAQVISNTGIPECGNPTGGTNAADPKYCTGGLRRIQWNSPLTKSEFEKMKERSGIKCLLFRGNFASERRTTRFDIGGDRQAASTVLAADTNNILEVCADDAHKLQGNTAALAAPKPVDQDTSAPKPQPKPVDQDTSAPKPQPKPIAVDTSAPKPIAVDTTAPKPQPKPVVVDTSAPTRQIQPTSVSRDTTGPFVASNQQGVPVGGQQQTAYQTPDQRPTGVQTGKTQREDVQTGRQQRDEAQPRRVAQNSKIGTVIQNYFSSSSQQQQQQQTLIINNAPQPWFIAEMKRMEEARAKAEAEKKLLAEKMKKEKEEKEKLEKDKKIAKGPSSTKESDTKKTEKVKDEPTAEDSFLKALMEAPSIEEIAKQYQEEQRREQEQYVQEQTTGVILQQSKKKGLEIKAKDVDEQESVQVVAQKKDRPQNDPYSDARTVPATTLRPPLEKSSLIAMLDEQAIKKGIPAPLVTPMPLPEKISFTRTSYTVTVPAVRQTIKTIMRAYQRPGELTQLERDRHASQLMSISEQLAGSAYGADYDTTQVLNDTARASELTAFMVAEHADNTAIVDSLHTIFATLTPLTKSEPVALTPPTGSVYEWSEQHFALLKYKIETAMQDTRNDKARELYVRALSLVRSAELYKDSDQQYWNSSADIKDAVRTLSLATALDRASRAGDQEVTEEQRLAEQKAKTREALLKDKGQEKGIWSSFLNMLGL